MSQSGSLLEELGHWFSSGTEKAAEARAAAEDEEEAKAKPPDFRM